MFKIARTIFCTKILPSFKHNELKMALIVRSDLKLTKGKIASQCAHASVLCYQKGLENKLKVINDWCYLGQPKIVLKIDSIEEMEEIYKKAKEMKIISEIVRDAGRTQVTSGTATVLGLGPDYTENIDSLIKHLKLL